MSKYPLGQYRDRIGTNIEAVYQKVVKKGNKGDGTMAARTGQEYIKGLQEQPREIWLQGERIDDVTTHPALRHGVETIAALYDMQHAPPYVRR